MLKVSWAATKMSNGEIMTILTSWLATVRPTKLIMKIDMGIKMILWTLFVLKVSKIAMKMPIG